MKIGCIDTATCSLEVEKANGGMFLTYNVIWTSVIKKVSNGCKCSIRNNSKMVYKFKRKTQINCVHIV